MTQNSVSQVATPAEAAALSTLQRVDYADAFSVGIASSDDRSPEAWARATLEEASARTRNALVAGWTSLGFELRSGSSDVVLGWTIETNTSDTLLLTAPGRRGLHGQLLFQRRRHDVLFATFAQIDDEAARLTWAKVTPVHLRTVEGLLAAAVERRASVDRA